MLLVSSGSGIGCAISLLIAGLAVSFVVSKNGIGYAYLAFASSESRCCSFFSGSGLVRVIVSLIASLAVSFVVSESGLVCAYQLSFSSASRCCTSPRAAASCALSALSSPASRCRRFFSDGGLVCAYQLSESIPYELVRGADFHHFGDNSGANFASLKGYSSSPDAAFMISAYNLQLARAGARSWTDYVPSDLNLADLPTRPDLPEWPGVRDYIGAAEIDFVFPSLSEWATW